MVRDGALRAPPHHEAERVEPLPNRQDLKIHSRPRGDERSKSRQLLPQQNSPRKRRGQGFVVDEKVLKPCVIGSHSGSNGSAVCKGYRDFVGVIARSGKQLPGPLEVHQGEGRSRCSDGPSEVELKGRTKRALRPAALA